MNRAFGVAWSLAAAGALVGCTRHRVEVAPIEVRPIHMTVDINIKVDRELDEFFAFEEEVKVPPTTPGSSEAPASPDLPARSQAAPAPAQQGVQQ